VIGMTALLEDTALDAEQRNYVETIRTSGDALLSTINDILDFSKVESGMLELEERPFELGACIEEAFDMLAPRAAQKGIDLLTAVIPALLQDTNASFAVLGTGDAAISADLRGLVDAYRTRVAFIEGYDEALAHEIFAGSDLTVVPSRYEPCGLTQMYALRYGSIPVVRATGGLADTIQHFDAANGVGNGSVFNDADPQGVSWGVRTALGWYADQDTWSQLVRNAMAADFSWPQQIPHYEELYRSLL